MLVTSMISANNLNSVVGTLCFHYIKRRVNRLWANSSFQEQPAFWAISD